MDSKMYDFKDIHTKTTKIMGDEVTAYDLFTTGYCNQLALAMHEIVKSSSLIAIYDGSDEDFERLETPWLIHAAVEVNGKVIDIDGIDSRERWISKWEGLATELIVETGQDGLNSFIYENKKIEEFSKEIASEIYDVVKNEVLGYLSSYGDIYDSHESDDLNL